MVTNLEHSDCGGKIIEKYRSEKATEQFVCVKCRKAWGVVSDLSDIEMIDNLKRKPDSKSIFYEFERVRWRANVPSSVISWLFNERLRRAFKMIPSSSKQCVGLDVGCSWGFNTQHLSQRLNGIIIGIDVEIRNLYRAKTRANLRACHEKSSSNEPAAVEYIHCDINYLPFKSSSIDLVLCVSVIEHVSDLERVVAEIRASMRKNGCLIMGYPIETRLFMAFLKLFTPNSLAIHDPRLWGKGFESSPETHKQSYTTIRCVLTKHFYTLKKEKSFFTVCPDQISWYECVKMKK